MGKTGQGVFLRGNEKIDILSGDCVGASPSNFHTIHCVGIVWGLCVADLGGSVRQGCF